MAVINQDVDIFLLDMVGQAVVTTPFDYLGFIDAQNVDGSQNLGAVVQIAVGKNNTRFAPFRINGQIEAPADQYTLMWDAQPGVKIFLYRSTRVQTQAGWVLPKMTALPARQLVTSSVGTSIAAGKVNVTTGGDEILPANVLRQSATLQNIGAVDVWIGGAAVVAGSAVKLAPGASMTIDKTTAAIYGITASGAADVVYLSEES